MSDDYPKSKRALAYFAYFALGVISVILLVLGFWTFGARDVLEINNAPVPVRTILPNATADGIIVLRVDYCKKVKATGKVRTSFVSKTREIFLPANIDTQAPECYIGDKAREIPIFIPHEIEPGEYKIHFRVAYQVNPLKSVIEEFDSKPFVVVKQ